MNDLDEYTEEEAAQIVAEIDAMIEKLLTILHGKPRDQMITSFAYLIASNLNDDEDAKDTLSSFVEQICEGYRLMKQNRSFQ